MKLQSFFATGLSVPLLSGQQQWATRRRKTFLDLRDLTVLFILSAVLLLPQMAIAQALNGSVVGNVTDPSGAAVPGASVTLTNLTTTLSRETVTDGVGGYNFATVQPGTYTIKIAQQGFATLEQTNINVTADAIVRVDLILKVGAMAESVVVAEQAATLETDSSEVRTEMDKKTLEALPIAIGRNYQYLLTTVPGMMPMSYSGSVATNPSRALTFAVNGGDHWQNNTRIDGASVSSTYMTDFAALNPTLESIDTVNVATNSFEADTGFSGGGGSVSVQTKSGTNSPHGALFEGYTGNDLKARPFFLPSNQSKGKLVYHEFGGAIGYKIIKDKLFYFASFEGKRDHEFANVLQTVPDALTKAGNMSESGTAIYDPATGAANGTGRTPFPNNQIPTARMDPIALKLNAMIPLPNVPGATLTNNFNGNGVFVFDRQQGDAKLNWNPTQKFSAFGRFSILNYNEIDPSTFGAVGGQDVATQGGAPGNAYGDTYSLTTSATYVLRPNLIIDGYFAWENDNTASEPFQVGQNLGLQLGIPGSNGPNRYQSGWPQFLVSNYSTFGTVASACCGLPYYRDNSQRQYVLNLNWSIGHHDLRMGTEIQQRYVNNMQIMSGMAQGAFTFGTGATQLSGGPAGNQFNSWGTFLLGLDTASIGTFFNNPPSNPTNQDWWSGYIRDRWNISRKLTASLGLRWDYYGFPNARVRGVGDYDIASNQVEICGMGAVSKNCGVSMPKKLFSPRIGLAYRLSSTLVVRAGYGINWIPFSLGRSLSLNNYPSAISPSYPAANSYSWYGTLSQGIPATPLPTINNGYMAAPNTVAMTAWPKSFQWPYSQNWNVTLQKELKWGFAGQVGYVANRTIRAMGDDVGSTFNTNVDLQTNTGTAGLPFYPTGRTAAVNVYGPHGNVMYNAMQSSLSRRFRAGLQIATSWTWSKAESPYYPVSPVVTAYSYLITRPVQSFDRTNTVTINGTWELPFGHGKQWLGASKVGNAVLGGWTLNSVAVFYSGLPFSITTSSTSLNMVGATQLPIQLKQNVAMYGNIGGAYFDPLAFAPVTTPSFGFVQPYNLRGPGQVNMDAGLSRTWRVKERFTMQLRAESFNFTNTPHFGNPGGTVSNLVLNGDGTVKNLAGFAQVTAIAKTGRDGGIDERQFRFTMRVSF
jgi:hypothetical protein